MNKQQRIAFEHAQVELAFSEGKVIECIRMDDKNDTWQAIFNPYWNWDVCNYRISPNQPQPTEKSEWQDVPTTSGLEGYEFRIKPTEKWAAEKQAFKEGKRVQYRYNIKSGASDDWDDVIEGHSAWDTNSFIYRIAPEPKLVPFTHEDAEQLIGKAIKDRGDTVILLITGIVMQSIYLSMSGERDYLELMENYTFLDGTPCGRYVEEEAL
jgi:hypothetical protein